jgi:nucleoside-diphosphate-sugar epimerase
MMKWLHKGIPLPLGAIDNRRSLVFIDNLVDLLMCCIRHPGAVGETFLVSDGEDLSTTQLLKRVAQAMGKKSRLVPIPVPILEACAIVLGKKETAARLCGSLEVDINHTTEILQWRPHTGPDFGFKATGGFFENSNNNNSIK